MRIILISATAIVALGFAACNEDSKKMAPPPSKTTPTSEVTPGDRTSTTTTSDAQRVPADNSGRNTRDDGTTLTPLDQGMSEQDLAITQAVRKAVVANKGLSINAQNVKIIAKDGVVTLRGPVASESERTAIVAVAEKVPEVHTVVNKLEIASR